MTNVQVFNCFPRCFLINQLFTKVSARTDTTFNFYGHLDNFRKRVSGEVRYINALFPEYTPHDEEYHLSRLFHVADIILGTHIIENMNATELFLLSISLYGHDWGMAVSGEEKEVILGKNSITQFPLLYNEQEIFKTYLAQNGVETKFDQPIWQEYVRKTHAQRSGNRIINFFESIDTGVGEAAARISEGHWLDLKQLTDHADFPTNFSVLGENINLRALAVYLRLIDLFDIGNDRTPYVIWKYVSPQNEFSKMEWAKHKALQPITCSAYQDGRIIVVDGSTDNHNVYAAIMDLKNYCNEQLRGCSDILAQVNDPCHNLNIYHAEWRIKARNFKPISVQFEFDRIKMFEVLSDEIYKGDVYIFLRELLQNSIDAIKMRKEILATKGLYSTNIGVVHIDIEDKENGDIIIVFQDDGIGMDEYILKNYLSVVGKSYYSSSDFKKLGLNMNPISRFGVGILSCFMIAEEIFIETFRDPYVSSSNEKLRVHIPSIDKQFRIESVSPNNCPIGTIIKIRVSRRKLDEGRFPKGKKLDVTAYLAKVAGFIEYPIFIKQSGRNSVIIHPETSLVDEENYKRSRWNIIKTKLSFPYETAFAQHSIEAAKTILKEEVLDLKDDLNIESMTGKLIFIRPADDNISLTNTYGTPYSIIDREGKVVGEISINEGWRDVKNESSPGSKLYLRRILSEPSDSNDSFRNISRIEVYVDGIFVTEAYESMYKYDSYIFKQYYSGDEHFIPPYLIVNIKKDLLTRLDLSRSRIINKDDSFTSVIINALDQYFSRAIKNEIVTLAPKERVWKLANIVTYNFLPMQRLGNLIDKNYLPICTVGNDNMIDWKESIDSSLNEVMGLPEIEFLLFRNSFLKAFKFQDEKCQEVKWRGGECVIDSDVALYNNITFRVINKIAILSIKRNLIPGRAGFIHFDGHPPLIRTIYVRRKESNPSYSDVIEKVLSDFEKVTNEEIYVLQDLLFQISPGAYIHIIRFSKPFENKMMYGINFLNFDHKFTQSFLLLVAKFLRYILLKEDNHNLSSLNHLIRSLPLFRHYDGSDISISELNRTINEIFDLAYKEGIITEIPEKWDIQPNDFVDGSIIVSNDCISKYYTNKKISEIINSGKDLEIIMMMEPLPTVE